MGISKWPYQVDLALQVKILYTKGIDIFAAHL